MGDGSGERGVGRSVGSVGSVGSKKIPSLERKVREQESPPLGYGSRMGNPSDPTPQVEHLFKTGVPVGRGG